jgi:hypothetical protein
MTRLQVRARWPRSPVFPAIGSARRTVQIVHAPEHRALLQRTSCSSLLPLLPHRRTEALPSSCRGRLRLRSPSAEVRLALLSPSTLSLFSLLSVSSPSPLCGSPPPRRPRLAPPCRSKHHCRPCSASPLRSGSLARQAPPSAGLCSSALSLSPCSLCPLAVVVATYADAAVAAHDGVDPAPSACLHLARRRPSPSATVLPLPPLSPLSLSLLSVSLSWSVR